MEGWGEVKESGKKKKKLSVERAGEVKWERRKEKRHGEKEKRSDKGR